LNDLRASADLHRRRVHSTSVQLASSRILQSAFVTRAAGESSLSLSVKQRSWFSRPRDRGPGALDLACRFVYSSALNYKLRVSDLAIEVVWCPLTGSSQVSLIVALSGHVLCCHWAIDKWHLP